MRVFVKNLPAQTTREELLELFAPYGQAVSSFLGPHLSNVEFATDEEAAKAIETLDG
jgi:RNA recognition motif-containing protein